MPVPIYFGSHSAPKNATFSSGGELAVTGPGGASKNPACAGSGGAASLGVSSRSRSRRAFSARRRFSSAATATGNSPWMLPGFSLTLLRYVPALAGGGDRIPAGSHDRRPVSPGRALNQVVVAGTVIGRRHGTRQLRGALVLSRT
jgi:hypothetical protein